MRDPWYDNRPELASFMAWLDNIGFDVDDLIQVIESPRKWQAEYDLFNASRDGREAFQVACECGTSEEFWLTEIVGRPHGTARCIGCDCTYDLIPAILKQLEHERLVNADPLSNP